MSYPFDIKDNNYPLIENSALIGDLSNKTKATIFRLVDAYNLPNRQALSKYLNISNSTLSHRFNNNLFPSDWVIQCVLETSVSLLWLVSGEGEKFIGHQPDTLQISSKKIQDGSLLDYAILHLDKKIFPSEFDGLTVVCINDDFYFVDYAFNSITDGLWLINLDEICSVRSVLRLPNKMVQISTGLEQKFECSIEEIEFVAKVTLKLTIPRNLS